MTNADKTREMRVRREADRYDLRIQKSRQRDPMAPDYRLYALIDNKTGGAINPPLADHSTCSWSLDQVQAFLTG